MCVMYFLWQRKYKKKLSKCIHPVLYDMLFRKESLLGFIVGSCVIFSGKVR